MNDIRIIKKYANRTMYDTSQSKYISLSDLKQYVMDEIPFEVRTAKTDNDITRQVLLQIISDEENAGTPLFTSEVLTRFIRMYGDSMQSEYSGYLEQISGFLEEQTEQFLEQFTQVTPKADFNPMTAWADLAKRNMETWQEAQKSMLRSSGMAQEKKDSD
jgi:polyhydroxyalkanoate synthesis repressor PhaR